MTDPEEEVMLGVVEPLPGMPRNRAYDTAVDAAHTALAAVRARLSDLRQSRADTNAEIKLLVEEEELLRRMTAVGEKKKPG